MDSSATPSLEVGFIIDTGASHVDMARLGQAVDSLEAKVVADVAKIEAATGKMMDLGGATARVRTFGNATSKEAQGTARELARLEKAGEALSRQMERENEVFGKTRSEIRATKVERAAAAAEARGLTELAVRLRSQDLELAGREMAVARQARAEAEMLAEAKLRAATAAEAEAEAVRRAASAHQLFEAVAKRKMAAYREGQAAAAGEARETERLAAAAARLRASIDPVLAAQQRFNAEMAEARTLIAAGAISLDDYVAKLRMERAALEQSGDAHGRMTGSAMNNRMAMQGASYQVQDFITQVSMGTNPINAFAVQGAQLAGQFSMIEGKAGNVARFFMSGWGLAITAGLMVFAPFVAKLLEGNNALDDALEKLKKDAVETEAAAKAKDRFAKSTEGVRAAILEQKTALDEAAKSLYSAAEQANAAANGQLNLEIKTRNATKAMLEKAIAEAEIYREQGERLRKRGSMGGSLAGREGADVMGMAAGVTEQRVAGLKARLAKETEMVTTAEQNLMRTRVGLAFEYGQKQATAVGRIALEYDRQIAALHRTADAQAAAGKKIDVGLTRQVTDLERRKQAAIDAANAQERLNKAAATGAGVAKFRSREQAIGLAGKELQGAGFRVDGNVQFGVTGGHANNADHNRFAADVNVGKGITEADVPNLKARFDKLALMYQARGYDVIWNGQRYAAGGSGPGGSAKGHRDHFHLRAPETIVGKGTGAGTVREQLAAFRDETRAAVREATDEEITDAQTKNLFALAKAYESSGGAALIGAARVKAETDAIRMKGDVEASVARDVGLAIAQRVADAARGTSAMRDQADAQAEVNRMVAAGLVPAERGADLVRDQLADLPLVAAIQAANATKNVDASARATAALEAQRAARKRLSDEERAAAFNTSMASGRDRLAELREEFRLVGETDAARAHALATIRATNEAVRLQLDPAQAAAYVEQQVRIADETERLAAVQRDYNAALSFTAEKWDLIASNVQRAGQGMADAFGSAGRAIGDMAGVYADYRAQEERAQVVHKANLAAATTSADRERENAKYALATSTAQIGAYGDMASAAKGFFKEKSAGYKAMQKAEQVFRLFEFAMSVRSMAQDIAETISSVANSGARAAAAGAEGVANQSKLPFPFNLAAMAATAAALVAAGVAVLSGGGGSGSKPPATNTGTETVFGDRTAQSESIKNAIDALKDVDTLTNTYARQMASSLRSIESQIGGIASLVVRQGDLNASGGIKEGFNKSFIGSALSKIPLIGGMLGGLFGTKTTVIGSGLYGGPQSLDSILNGGFDASYYSDVQKKKKLFGITTSNKTSTQYGAADAALEAQFGLLMRSFYGAIVSSAGPLGEATADIENRLKGFVLNIGKIDLKGLTGAEIEEKLSAVFGAAADNMANAAFPGITQFQKVGEGAFETLVRVASTVEAVSGTLDLLGQSAQQRGLAARMGLADQFDTVSALTDAAESYFRAFYTEEEQAAAKTAQMAKVFASLGLSMPPTLTSFRQLVEVQDLTTAAGQETYATLLKLAPAFADLQSSMEGAKSAADIVSERADLQRQLLQLRGDTAALRALDLAKLDASNQALQQEVWAVQAAQEAAKAAEELGKAWQSAGDTIMDEVRRIRGLSDMTGAGTFASLMGRFNAITTAARGGDLDAVKTLPQLSQNLLKAATDSATSRQELDRIRAQTAASLEATYNFTKSIVGTPAALSNAALLTAGAATQPTAAANDGSMGSLAGQIDGLKSEIAKLREDNNSGQATIAGNTKAIKQHLDNVTGQSGGDAISTVAAAA